MIDEKIQKNNRLAESTPHKLSRKSFILRFIRVFRHLL
jgi:hypothetical protein